MVYENEKFIIYFDHVDVLLKFHLKIVILITVIIIKVVTVQLLLLLFHCSEHLHFKH